LLQIILFNNVKIYGWHYVNSKQYTLVLYHFNTFSISKSIIFRSYFRSSIFDFLFISCDFLL